MSTDAPVGTKSSLDDSGDVTESVGDDDRERNDRRICRMVAAATVAPILISAVLAARGGWIPTNDAAAAVLRSKHALGTSPDLVGLYAWPSSEALGVATFTAGPWHLWWMSIPIQVLGTTWGPLLSMAVLNAGMVLLAGWAVRRRLGHRAAILATLFFGLLIWSIGADAFASPVPVVAVVAPFAAFVFIAWALAVGDEGLLPIFAALASFLVLSFPETTLLVPVIGGAAVVIWFFGRRGLRRADPDGRGARRRRSIRLWVISVLITVVFWIPPSIEQFTNDPGNLTDLYRAQAEMPAWMSIRRSIAALFSLFAGYPFWLRGSTDDSFLTFTAGVPSLVATVTAAVVLAALLVTAGVVSYRRQDRPALVGVVLAAWAMVATWLHMLRSPHGQYFLPVWVIAMFVTFAIAFALLRGLRVRSVPWMPVAAVAASLLLLVVNLPDRAIPHFTATTPEQVQLSKYFDARVLPAVRGRGTVTIAPPFDGTFPYAAALAVALDDAGIPMCADSIVSMRGYDNPDCDGSRSGPTVIYRSAATIAQAPPGETLVARRGTLDRAERLEWKDLSLKLWAGVDELAKSGGKLRVAPRYFDFVAPVMAPSGHQDDRGSGDGPYAFIDDPGVINTSFEAQKTFAVAIISMDIATDGRVMLTELPGMSDADLLRWAKLRSKLAKGVVVTVKDES